MPVHVYIYVSAHAYMYIAVQLYMWTCISLSICMCMGKDVRDSQEKAKLGKYLGEAVEDGEAEDEGQA